MIHTFATVFYIFMLNFIKIIQAKFNMIFSFKKKYFHSLAVSQLVSLRFFSASVLTTAHVSIVEIIK